MEQNTVEIQGQNNLVRDLHSKAILNTNARELNNYEVQKNMMNRHNAIDQEIIALREDVDLIKHMLQTLINKG